MCLTGSGRFSIHEERLQLSEAGRKQKSQFENVFKSLTHLSTQVRIKVLNLYLLNKLRSFGDKSRDSLATDTTLNFSGPCRRVRPAKLTNHSARTNLEINKIKIQIQRIITKLQSTFMFLTRRCK